MYTTFVQVLLLLSLNNLKISDAISNSEQLITTQVKLTTMLSATVLKISDSIINSEQLTTA